MHSLRKRDTQSAASYSNGTENGINKVFMLNGWVMQEFALRGVYVGPYMRLAVSAFTGRVGYIHRKFLPPLLRVDELCQPPHEAVAQAADVRGIPHGLAHPSLLLGHRFPLCGSSGTARPARGHSRPRPHGSYGRPPPTIPGSQRPLHPAAGGGHPESPHASLSLPGDAPGPRSPLPMGR